MSDMAVDAVLWLILAAMIGLVWSGCILTRRHKKPAIQSEQALDHRFDRAA